MGTRHRPRKKPPDQQKAQATTPNSWRSGLWFLGSLYSGCPRDCDVSRAFARLPYHIPLFCVANIQRGSGNPPFSRGFSLFGIAPLYRSYTNTNTRREINSPGALMLPADQPAENLR